MKHSVISRIFVLFAVMAMTAIPSLSFAGDSTMLSNPAVLNPNIQKGSGGGVPVGTVIAWPVASNPSDPENWLECNGQSVSQTAYPELAALMAHTPNYQGMFLRGYGGQASYHWGGVWHGSDGLGVMQGDATRNITGSMGSTPLKVGAKSAVSNGNGAIYSERHWGRSYTDSAGADVGVSFGFDASRAAPTAQENRPVNMAVRYLIKALP